MSASSSQAARYSNGPTKLSRRRGHAHGHDFTSFFNSDVPKWGDPIESQMALPSWSHYGTTLWSYRKVTDATTEAELARAADKIVQSPALIEERTSPDLSNKRRDPPLHRNEQFIIHLFKSSFALTKRTGKNDFDGMDRLVAKHLRFILDTSPPGLFSFDFLIQMAAKASSELCGTILDQLFAIMQQHLASHTGAPSASAVDSLSPGQRRSRSPASVDKVSSYDTSESGLSRMMLSLMRASSRMGYFERVKACFELLRRHSLAATVDHYQLQVIALFRERYAQLTGSDRIDVAHQTQQLQSKILEIRQWMQADDVPLDDTFLATIVFGLSAPIHGPLSKYFSKGHASSARRLVRTIFDQVNAQHRSLESTASVRKTPFADTPRLLSAVTGAEVGAVNRLLGNRPDDKATALRGVSDLLGALDYPQPSAKNIAVGVLKSGVKKDRHINEAQLTAIYLKLRLSATLGNMPDTLASLERLLSIWPLPQYQDDTEQTRDLILKQRSGIIFLFSHAMQERGSMPDQDAALAVLELALSKNCFERIWGSGVCIPSNPFPGYDRKAYDPDAMIIRLWTRWIHAWSADYMAHGDFIERADSRDKVDYDPNRLGEIKTRYITFAGRYPWQTIKRGLKLLNHTIDQYETLRQPAGSISEVRGKDEDASPAPIAAEFASLFKHKILLDNIVKFTLRGGKPAANETVATHVHRRLTQLIRTLTRVRVPARTWEHVESSMLGHLARIDRTVLPTENVREAMDEIQTRKRAAYLRINELAVAFNERKEGEAHDAVQAGKGEAEGAYAKETGSIFVLRQMLAKKEREKEAAATAAAAAEGRTRAVFN